MKTDTITPSGHTADVDAIRAELDRLLDHRGRRQNEPQLSLVGEHLTMLDRIECASGMSLSVQASAFHYCSPRESEGPWSAVEIGFPTRRIEAFKQYADDPKRLTKTFYGWVPIDVVAQVIADHGGFAKSQPLTSGDVS